MAKASEKFSIKKRIKSFEYAFDGLKFLLRNEHNTRIHLVATSVAILLGLYLNLYYFEWMVLILCIGGVWAMEIINSAIEKCCDLYTTDFNQKIKIIKDLGAGAVLVASLTALIIGLILFIPKIIKLLTY